MDATADATNTRLMGGGDEAFRVVVSGFVDDPRGGAGFDDAAGGHDRGMVGHLADHGQIVRDEEVGKPQLPLQVAQEVDHAGLDRDIERARGFVADDERRFQNNRAGEGDPLFLATRKLMRVTVERGGRQPAAVKHFDGRHAAFIAGEIRAVHNERLGDYFLDAVHRVHASGGVLKDHLDETAELSGSPRAVDRNAYAGDGDRPRPRGD